MASLVRQVQEVRESVEGPGRYRDLTLILRREKTQETILWAGGRFDRLTNRFTDIEPEFAAYIDLEESQIDYAIWFDQFLGDFREGYPRDISAALAAGDRRAGKTFDAYYCQIAALIDVPIIPVKNLPAVGWTVSKTFRERDELDELMAARIPAEWYHATKAPERRYDFVHGSVLRNLSEDDPDSLKQGKVDWLLFNEVQKMRARSVVNGLYGTADHAGLCTMTANKPRGDSRGEWLFDLKDAIDDEVKTQAGQRNQTPLGIKYFLMSSKLNTKIDQPARKRVSKLAAIIDPTTGEADDDDSPEWKRPGDKACWEFDKHRHLRRAPDVGPPDITSEVLCEQVYGSWVVAGGIDFQNRPHIPAAFAKLYGDPDDPTFYFVGEFVGERRETEEQFLERFEDFAPKHGWTRQNLLWIGDASGDFQGSRHDFEGEERDSFAVFRDDGWEIIPSQPPRPGSKTGRGKNPDVPDRLQLVNERLRRDKIFIDADACPWLAECFSKAETKREDGKRKLVGNRYSHMFDAATYLVWRLSSRLNAGPKGPPMVTVPRRGSDE